MMTSSALWSTTVLLLSAASGFSVVAREGGGWRNSRYHDDGEHLTASLRGDAGYDRSPETVVILSKNGHLSYGTGSPRAGSEDIPINEQSRILKYLEDVLQETENRPEAEYDVTEVEEDGGNEEFDDWKSTKELENDYVRVAQSAADGFARSRRRMTSSSSAGSQLYVVDLLVVVDNALYRRALKRHRENADVAVQDLNNYYGQVVSLVDFRYSQISDPELSIRVRLAGIFIAQDRAASPWSERNIQSFKHSMILDPNIGLDRFHGWLKENAAKLPKYDHAMAFTGYSLSTVTGTHTAGMAYIGTVCKVSDGYACSIIQEDGGLSSVSTAVHELGHSLGAKHDGEGENNVCPASRNYIMAPGNSLDKDFMKNFFLFSPCTIRQFKSVLSTEDGECLLDSSANGLTTMPGEVISPDEQCKDVFGSESGLCEMGEPADEICARLWCVKPEKEESCVTRGHLTAVLGTPCGPGKVCKTGQCLERQSVLVSLTETGKTRNEGTPSNRATKPPRNHLQPTEKPVKTEQGRPKCKEDTSPDYCRRNVYQRPDLCQRSDMAAYCCFSCSFI